MPVSRMRMRPWLEQMIDSGAIPGLRWVDKSQKMFSVPWKHAARHGWEMDKDASLFKMWAIHTGKYSEGQACDPKTWKANFRCAMNSLPDIEEVKGKSVNKGHQAVRVFKMLPVAPKSRDRRNRISKRRPAKVKYEEPSSDSDSVSPSSPLQSHPLSTRDIRVPESSTHTDTQESVFSSPEVPPWSSMVEGFDNFQRRFEVSPPHICPGDDEIIEICAQWERERSSSMDTGLFNNGFLNDEVHCSSPGSMYSEASSADEFDDLPQYTTLSSSISSTDSFLTNLFPFSHRL